MLNFQSVIKMQPGDIVLQAIRFESGTPVEFVKWEVAIIGSNWINFENGSIYTRFFRDEFPLWGWQLPIENHDLVLAE